MPTKAAGEQPGSAHPPARQPTLEPGSRQVPGAPPRQGKPQRELCGGGEQQGWAGRAAALRCFWDSCGLCARVAPSHGTREQGRDLNVSLPATDIEAASAFNVGAAANSVHSLWDLHPEGHRCPRPFYPRTVLPGPAHSSSSPERSAPSRCRRQGAASSVLPGPSPWAAWGCSPGPAWLGPWSALGIPAPSLLLPQVGLDGAGRSHSCDEANRISQAEGDVLRGPGGRGAAGVRPAAAPEHQRRTRPSRMNHTRIRTARQDGVPCLRAGLHRSPVQNHHHHSAVGAQESCVLQFCLLGLFGGDEPHALGALGDELTARA